MIIKQFFIILEEEVYKELEQGIMDASDTSLIICQLQLTCDNLLGHNVGKQWGLVCFFFFLVGILL